MSVKLIHIDNIHSTAQISIYGGQVLTFCPKGSEEVLWLSETAVYKEGKAIRGGIPFCWPWFGPKEGYPSHGFARTFPWSLVDQTELDDGSTEVHLVLKNNEETEKLWPYAFKLDLGITIGKTLEIKLKTTNMDHRPITFTEALHSYFKVSAIQGIQINGLIDSKYFDQLSQSISTLKENIKIDGEYDRIFDHDTSAEIVDVSAKRTIVIDKKNSGSSIVWNPWIEKSARMGDVEEGAYKKFVCVESGNTGDYSIHLEPGVSHELILEIGILEIDILE